MRTTTHEVDLAYTPDELRALFARANEEDVDQGGRYDARSGAINIWSHHWTHPATERDSTTLGTFYFHWGDENRLWLIECDEGFSLDDLLRELAVLEMHALGRIKHGREA